MTTRLRGPAATAIVLARDCSTHHSKADPREAQVQAEAARSDLYRQRGQRPGCAAAGKRGRRLRQYVLGRAAASEWDGHDVDALANSRLEPPDARLHAR